MNGYETYQVRNPNSHPKQFREARVREAIRAILRTRSRRFKRIDDRVSFLRALIYAFLFLGASLGACAKSRSVILPQSVAIGLIILGILAVSFLLLLEAWWRRLQDSEVREHFSDADFEQLIQLTSRANKTA